MGRRQRYEDEMDKQFCCDCWVVIGLISLFFMLSVLFVPVYYMDRFTMKWILIGKSVTYGDKCRVSYISAEVSNEIDLSCTQDLYRKPKIDIECSNSSAKHATLHCDNFNRCAPYCFEKRERLGSISYYHCSWDMHQLMLNVSIQVSTIAPGNSSKSFKYSKLIRSGPTDLEKSPVVSTGANRIAYCDYQTNSEGEIVDISISSVSPMTHKVSCVLSMILIVIVVSLCVWLANHSIYRMFVLLFSYIPQTVRYRAHDWYNNLRNASRWNIFICVLSYAIFPVVLYNTLPTWHFINFFSIYAITHIFYVIVWWSIVAL